MFIILLYNDWLASYDNVFVSNIPVSFYCGYKTLLIKSRDTIFLMVMR